MTVSVVLEVWIRSGLATRAARSLPLLDQHFRHLELEVYLLISESNVMFFLNDYMIIIKPEA